MITIMLDMGALAASWTLESTQTSNHYRELSITPGTHSWPWQPPDTQWSSYTCIARAACQSLADCVQLLGMRERLDLCGRSLRLSSTGVSPRQG